MNSIAAHNSEYSLPLALGNEVNIQSRREIEPLLAKARHILMFYDEAMNCSTSVFDRNGLIIRTGDHKHQAQFCDLCKKYCHNPSQIWQGNEYPCEKVHTEALAVSRRMFGTYVYACTTGFIFWTSPLYRKGNYAGALIAGQVLSGGHKEAAAKFYSMCKDRMAAEKINKTLYEAEAKSHEEIQAMARLLGVCAWEISEKGENSSEMIRCMVWQKEKSKKPGEQTTTRAKKNQGSCEAGFEHPMEKERLLLAAFRRGDKKTGARILSELMNSILAAIPENLEIIRGRAIELLVLLSRAAARDSDALLETNNRYLKRIQESKTAEELMENLHLAAEGMAGTIFSFQGIRHASVLRRAERYIWENYTRKISLEEIAKASGLSAPYFSTIFKEEMGENLSSYLNRLRIERAASLLTESVKPLNKIAGLCGFEDQSWFSKLFKCYTGMTPGKYRKTGNRTPALVNEL